MAIEVSVAAGGGAGVGTGAGAGEPPPPPPQAASELIESNDAASEMSLVFMGLRCRRDIVRELNSPLKQIAAAASL
jgi:hypothetical protein